MSESAAEMLDPAQAAELSQVIDLQARWENMRDDPERVGVGFSTPDLQGRQRAYEMFRARLAAYTARYRAAQVPELTLNTPDRVGAWCRAVRAVFRQAEPGAGSNRPTHAVEKAYRLADRIAARLKTGPVGREVSPGGTPSAVRNLDAVIRWCDGLSGPPAPIGSLRPAGETPGLPDQVA
jgi:hypothetical protein